MKKTILTFLFGISLLFAACAQKDEITVKYEGQEKTFEPKSSLVRHGTLTMKPDETAWSTEIHLANYEIDASKADLSVQQAIKSPEQVRVMIYLYGEKGTDKNTPTKTGEYVNKPAADVFNKVANVFVYYFKDGKEIPKILNMNSDYQAKVNITSVTDEAISGTVDASGGGFSVKGSFTAKK